jgi:hypothetical protein
MSDNWLKFVSTSPSWQPTPQAAEKAARLLKSFLPSAEEIESEFKDEIEFIDAGGNWEGVKCLACGTDLKDWWSDTMRERHRSQFRDLEVALPCCGLTTNLNELRYVWPVAFSRFVLSAQNPGIDTTAEQERALSACLGSPLRKIWAHI